MDIRQIEEISRLIQQDRSRVAQRVAKMFGISRQAASAKLAQLRADGWIQSTGTGRGIQYELVDKIHNASEHAIRGLSEDRVWHQDCLPYVRDLPTNVRDILHYGATEMVNNAIDHSGSKTVTFFLYRNAISTTCVVADKGEGIFLKIQRALDLYDVREAILELVKGKLTTDPAHHTGEGIFFCSKMFDVFIIASGDLTFKHSKNLDVISDSNGVDPVKGTQIYMQIDNGSLRTTREIFDKFAPPDEFAFSETIVPVRLAQHEGENLISRSQAKRLTRRFERFQSVVLDFSDVTQIGQGFADEVFRVFRNAHPQVTLTPINMNQAVEAMVSHVGYPQNLSKLK